jgi:hypothetical protein
MSERDEEDRERERPSWKEIDQRRDRSRHTARAPSRGGKKSQKDEWLRKMALKKANQFFQGKQGTPEHEKRVAELLQHFGTKKFFSLAKKYLEDFGSPKHWGIQFLFLDYPDPAVVIDILNQMAALFPERSPREQQAFLSKLRNLSSLAEDGEVLDRAAELLSSLD